MDSLMRASSGPRQQRHCRVLRGLTKTWKVLSRSATDSLPIRVDQVPLLEYRIRHRLRTANETRRRQCAVPDGILPRLLVVVGLVACGTRKA